MGKIPYFGKTHATDDAREFIKEQMKRNTAKDLSTDRLRGSLARTAMMPEIEAAKIRALGTEGPVAARRYRDAGEVPPQKIAGKAPSYGGGGAGGKGASAFMQGLRDGGLTNPIGLSAAMGHAEAESGFNFSATGDYSTATGKKMAYGGFQWNDRQPEMRRWITAQGKDPADPYWQGRFGAHEMETSEKGPGERLKNAQNLQEANEAMVAFLRPAGAKGGMRTVHRGNIRQAASEFWFKKLTHMKPEDTATASNMPQDGKTYKEMNSATVNVLAANYPEHMENWIPRYDIPTGKKDTYMYEWKGEQAPANMQPIEGQPVDPATGQAKAPANPAPTPPVVVANAAPPTQAPPVTAAPPPPDAPINPAPVAIQAPVDDDDDDNDEDPWTGL